MKTIALPRSPRSIFGSVLILGGLFALYYYRRNGGTYSQLLSGANEQLKKARGVVADASDRAAEAVDSVRSRVSSEVSRVADKAAAKADQIAAR